MDNGNREVRAVVGGGTSDGLCGAPLSSGLERPVVADLERDLATVRLPLDQASTLPGRFYHDPAIYQEELRRIFSSMWLCVGRDEDVAKPGDYMTRAIGSESVIVMRDARGEVNAFHNVCRHRGSRLLTEASGTGLSKIQCPYHAWTYDLDGSLRGTPHMEDARDFDRRRFSLNPVRLERWDGFLFISLDPRAPALSEFLGEMGRKFARYGMGDLRRGRRVTYTVQSNWKMLAENYSECYHCFLIHPELNRVSHYLSGSIDLTNQATVGGWMDLREDEFNSMTVSGKTARKPLPALDAEDQRRIHYYIVYPNLLLSLHPDYVMTHTIWPDGPGRSEIICEFLFHPDEMARPGFDPSDAVEFWDMTNKQDWRVCELAWQGTSSTGYERGRLSSLEWMVHIFDNFVADRLTGRKPVAAGVAAR
ncbi:MAG TPA: aromatic ring-hydroxylating dioxygenase subunit alpha [Candidatus Polarisedimenticolia bacterium]|nr:aromatic ring-hydroxylating dioxygenase subunit alpha [Candidatus Polarisedimenticolia bacterium]